MELNGSIRPEGSLMPVPILERQEYNTESPFSEWREKSSQRIIYTRKTPHLITEFNFRHVLFAPDEGEAHKSSQLYQASFTGYNMQSPLSFRVGRIITGNNVLQTIDGISLRYPWGKRLSTTLDIGRVAPIDNNSISDSETNQPSFSEGRIQYNFDHSSFMAIKTVQNFDESSSGIMFGYNNHGLLFTGEYLAGSATNTAALEMQYYNDSGVDIGAQYKTLSHNDKNTAMMRHFAGYETGNLYFEAGMGSHFLFGGNDDKSNDFYEGSISWGLSDQDRLTFGSIHESAIGSSSRTIYASAERRVSPNTRFGLSVEDCRLIDGPYSYQQLEASWWRRVHWGYYDLRAAIITGGSESSMQKDIRLSAGYEY